MEAYLFSGWTSQLRHGHWEDGCSTMIVYGGSEAAAKETFEKAVAHNGEGIPIEGHRLDRLHLAPVLPDMITEYGAVPLDWEKTSREADDQASVNATESTEEQGYWVNCDETVIPGALPPSIDALQQSLPREVHSGLNWHPAKKFFFILSVLNPPAAPEMPPDDEGMEADTDFIDVADSAGAVRWVAENRDRPFIELVDRELAVIIHARNSVIAAWLWRTQVAGTPRAEMGIRIEPWCGAVPCGWVS